LTPLAEVVLGKDRILEPYVNVIEWGPGIFGAEAAAQHHYQRSARELTREQAAALAAVIPARRGAGGRSRWAGTRGSSCSGCGRWAGEASTDKYSARGNL
jgi:hypothetical protein